MDRQHHEHIRQAVAERRPIADPTAMAILQAGHDDLPALLAATNTVRLRNFGNRVKLCSIVNAKCGSCSEDCSYCAQSAHHPQAATQTFNRLDPEQLQADRQQASQNPIGHFGIVTSGEALGEAELERVRQALAGSDTAGPHWCASLGCLTQAQLERLRAAGLRRFHHNLETAESFFPQICTTHSYAKRLATVRHAKAAGLQVCCGGILGLGESLEQRVEFARTLRDLEVDSIPMNFLVPIPGTRLERAPTMTPLEILLAIVMFRLVCPTPEIRLAAGRVHLRRLQAMVFHAGCSGIMIGDLLTIAGDNVQADLQMLADLGLTPEMTDEQAPTANQP